MLILLQRLPLKKFRSGVLLFLRPFIYMGGFNQVRLRISGIPKEAPSGFSWVQHQACLPLQSFPSVQTHGKHSSEMGVKERGRDVCCCSRSRGLSPSPGLQDLSRLPAASCALLRLTDASCRAAGSEGWLQWTCHLYLPSAAPAVS